MSDRGSLAALGRDWSTLAQADPLWAICVDPAKRGGRWDLAEFLSSGEAEISQVVTELDGLGMAGDRQATLDFGCGVGRVTGALSAHFRAVIGVDISPPMLARASAIHSGNDRLRFRLNDSPDLAAFAADSFDLVYSSLVLQHLPPKLAAGYLAEFLRVTRPGGAVVIVVPEAHHRTPRGLVYAYAPQPMIGWLQRRVFGYPAPMRMHTVPARLVAELAEGHGGSLVASFPRPLPGHWRMAAHYVAPSRPERAPSGPASR